KEILENQKNASFEYESPKFSELSSKLRIDSGYYCYDYKRKQFLISNYKNGARLIDEWGFNMKRGQNLQESQIGKSINSTKPKVNFYTVIRPTDFSELGTVKKIEYLGNPKKLKTLKKGDIVFTATGTIGKCILFDDPKEN
ncbi:34700_t:CDS:1, partial [Racocetra persica]